MRNLQMTRKVGIILTISFFIGIGAISIAIAQSKNAFNLNSPASFPVDI